MAGCGPIMQSWLIALGAFAQQFNNAIVQEDPSKSLNTENHLAGTKAVQFQSNC